MEAQTGSMGKVLVVEHVSLDGVMQGPARADEDTRDGFDLGGWAQARSDPRMQEAVGARMGGEWALLAGRRTYEDFAAVWPNRPDPNPMGEALTKGREVRGLEDPLGAPAVGELDVASRVTRLRRSPH